MYVHDDILIFRQNAFQVGTQQDSQEVLRLILNKLKTEEIQVAYILAIHSYLVCL